MPSERTLDPKAATGVVVNYGLKGVTCPYCNLNIILLAMHHRFPLVLPCRWCETPVRFYLPASYYDTQAAQERPDLNPVSPASTMDAAPTEGSMTETKFSEGLYVLSEDVTNPNVDKRYKNDWRHKPVIKAGTKFRVRMYYPEIEGHEDISWPEAYPEGSWTHQTVFLARSKRYDDDKANQLGCLLAPLLRPAERTLKSILGDHQLAPSRGSSGWLLELLAYMLDTGRLTLDTLEEDAKGLTKLRDDEGDETGELTALLKRNGVTY